MNLATVLFAVAAGFRHALAEEPRGSTAPAQALVPRVQPRSGDYIPFCADTTQQKRASKEDIAYKGNVGSTRYGCNIMLIPDSIGSQYEYTMRFENQGPHEQDCKCWNKIGPTGEIDGFFAGHEAVNFTLAPAGGTGGTQMVAFDDNSQVGCACHAGTLPLTAENRQFASTWVEGDFGNQQNRGWSGYDASCLVSASEGMDIPGLRVCGCNSCSTIPPGGKTGTRAYLHGMEDVDGAGPSCPPGPVALTVQVDFA
ncbi:hypothetical protein PWT90_10008 [Aphanocladium album]|nr:hypothetical protein PWT90_10008 [Aphanocladium album]